MPKLSSKPWENNSSSLVTRTGTPGKDSAGNERTAVRNLTGISDLDNILNGRNLEEAAFRLTDYIAKRRMDRQTVWQGLPGIMSTILGGGIQRVTNSWFDCLRRDKLTPIRKVTTIEIYPSTSVDSISILFENCRDVKPSECNITTESTRFWEKSTKKNHKVESHHPCTLMLATSERQFQTSECSIFNVVFNSESPDYCTFDEECLFVLKKIVFFFLFLFV